jgi:hypothetical protein
LFLTVVPLLAQAMTGPVDPRPSAEARRTYADDPAEAYRPPMHLLQLVAAHHAEGQSRYPRHRFYEGFERDLAEFDLAPGANYWDFRASQDAAWIRAQAAVTQDPSAIRRLRDAEESLIQKRFWYEHRGFRRDPREHVMATFSTQILPEGVEAYLRPQGLPPLGLPGTAPSAKDVLLPGVGPDEGLYFSREESWIRKVENGPIDKIRRLNLDRFVPHGEVATSAHLREVESALKDFLKPLYIEKAGFDPKVVNDLIEKELLQFDRRRSSYVTYLNPDLREGAPDRFEFIVRLFDASKTFLGRRAAYLFREDPHGTLLPFETSHPKTRILNPENIRLEIGRYGKDPDVVSHRQAFEEMARILVRDHCRREGNAIGVPKDFAIYIAASTVPRPLPNGQPRKRGAIPADLYKQPEYGAFERVPDDKITEHPPNEEIMWMSGKRFLAEFYRPISDSPALKGKSIDDSLIHASYDPAYPYFE